MQYRRWNIGDGISTSMCYDTWEYLVYFMMGCQSTGIIHLEKRYMRHVSNSCTQPLYIYMYTHIYTYVLNFYTYIYIYIYIFIHIYTHMYVYVYRRRTKCKPFRRPHQNALPWRNTLMTSMLTRTTMTVIFICIGRLIVCVSDSLGTTALTVLANALPNSLI